VPTSPRKDARTHPTAPLTWSAKPVEWSRKLAEVVNGVMQGRTNNRGSISLTVTGSSTPLIDARIDVNSVITLMASNESARNLLPNITSLTEGACVLHHSPASLSSSASSTTAGGRGIPIYSYVVWS